MFLLGERKTSEFALEPIPSSHRLSVIATTFVWASLTLDPSAPYLAAWWASSFTFPTIIVSVIIANLALSVFSALSGYIAAKEGLSYALAAEKIFGLRGVAVPSAWSGFVSIGWLAFSVGVVADLIVSASSAPAYAYYVLAILFMLLFPITAYKGFKAMARLAYIGVPLLVILIVASSLRALGLDRGISIAGQISVNDVALLSMLVLGTFVNGSITLSFDYQRWCRNARDAAVTAFTNFLGFWSFIILATAVPAAVSGTDLMGFLTKTGLALVGVVTFFLLLWTSADNQLYSASLSWTVLSKSLGGRVAREALVILGAVLTVMLAFIKLHTFAIQWLSLLTAVSLPAGVVIWTHYYIVGRGRLPNPVSINAKAFAAWILGSLAYILTYGNIYSVLLELAVTSLAYIALNIRDLLKSKEQYNSP